MLCFITQAKPSAALAVSPVAFATGRPILLTDPSYLPTVTAGAIAGLGVTDAWLLGVVWGWLPCGLVYSVLVWALSAGSAVGGGLLMASFGVGTLPTLLALGAAAARLTPRDANSMPRRPPSRRWRASHIGK